MERALAIAREEQVALFFGLRQTEVPGWSMFELSVGDLENELSDEEVRTYFARVLGVGP
jgi:hypothetical protein